MRDELLNETLFFDLDDARTKIAAWITDYNDERPHQALAMKVPADLYAPSDRPYRGLGELDYPLHDWATH